MKCKLFVFLIKNFSRSFVISNKFMTFAFKIINYTKQPNLYNYG